MKTLIFSDDGEIAAQMCAYLKEGFENTIATLKGEEGKCRRSGARSMFVFTGQPTASNLSGALRKLKDQNSVDLVFIGSTAIGRDTAGLLAGSGGLKPISEVTSVQFSNDKATTTRFLYGGKSVLTEESDSNLFVVASGISEASQTENETEITEMPLDHSPVTVEGEEQKSKGGVDIEKAKVIVSIGRGLGKPEGLKLVEQLASAVKGEVAGSRPVCLDYHWLSEDRQVGLSGKKVKPRLYIALGISGQIQHIAGMRGSRTVVAINKDKSAPIFEECDYGLVGDLYTIVPKLVAALTS